jgi:hypothetical protein
MANATVGVGYLVIPSLTKRGEGRFYPVIKTAFLLDAPTNKRFREARGFIMKATRKCLDNYTSSA